MKHPALYRVYKRVHFMFITPIMRSSRHWRLSCSLAAIFWAMLEGFSVYGQDLNELTQTRAAREGIAVLPSQTDPAIKTFDSPHRVHVDRDIVIRQAPAKPMPRQQLLVWLTGTGGQTRGAGEFCQLAMREGYHVIKLMYPNEIPATVCKRSEDPEAFEKFRLCIIQGGSSPRITVEPADSIENRLVKLLKWLSRARARENWSQFLTSDGGLAWEKLAFAGQSQGGGHAVLIGMKHRVARVIATGAPKDWSLHHNAPAAWLSGPSATEKSLFFTFNHMQDQQGSTPEQQSANLEALGLLQFGPKISVDGSKPPYQHSRCLTTNYPGIPLESSTAHGSVSANGSVEQFGPVWRYMLTELAR